MTVSATIYNQLGGRLFGVMTGAKNLVSTDNSLRFSLPGSITKNRLNKIVITLNGRDLYDITTYKIWGTKVTELETIEDVYAEQLRNVFSDMTGLAVSLGTMRG